MTGYTGNTGNQEEEKISHFRSKVHFRPRKIAHRNSKSDRKSDSFDSNLSPVFPVYPVKKMKMKKIIKGRLSFAFFNLNTVTGLEKERIRLLKRRDQIELYGRLLGDTTTVKSKTYKKLHGHSLNDKQQQQNKT